MSEEPAGGAELDATLSIAIGGLAAEMKRASNFRNLQATAVQQATIATQVPIVGGAGKVDQPDLLQVKSGYNWSIRRITTNGFTAGSVNAYRNDANGEPIIPWPQAGMFTFGRGEMLLQPMDRIVITATGITAALAYVPCWITFDFFEQWYLPFYIG